MVLTAYFALSSVTGLSCHRRRAGKSAQLDASVGASGPHDLAVRRVSALVSSAACVHRIQPRVRDDRDTPLCGVDDGSYGVDLGKPKSGKFFKTGLDRHIAKQPVGQITSSPVVPQGARLIHFAGAKVRYAPHSGFNANIGASREVPPRTGTARVLIPHTS